MATTAIDQVRALFAGLRARDADAASRHVHPARYVEHDPRVPDGIAGLRDHVRGLPEDNRLALVRIFQDGDCVVAQAQGSVDGQGVFFDVFRLEDGLIVEHWGFAAPAGPPNESGHTQVDGPTEPRDAHATAANKAIVRDYYETVHIAGRHDQVRRFMSGETQARHEPGVRDGVTAFEQDLAVLTRDRTIDEIRLLRGRGDFVFVAARGTHRGEPCAYVDLYRVEGGKLVEHWGFPQAFPAQGASRNGNGLL